MTAHRIGEAGGIGVEVHSVPNEDPLLRLESPDCDEELDAYEARGLAALLLVAAESIERPRDRYPWQDRLRVVALWAAMREFLQAKGQGRPFQEYIREVFGWTDARARVALEGVKRNEPGELSR